MLKRIIHKVARRHHHWRGVEFNELAEIYTSMTLRKFGFSMIGIFVPVFLYQNGVILRDIFLFFSLFFFFRIFTPRPLAKIIGRIGPKHSIAISIVISISFLLMLLTFSTIRWPLAALAFMYSTANGLFFFAFNVDFSKVNHSEHGGKELGWLLIFQNIGGALGPLIGGIVATIISPNWTILLALSVLVASLIPLFLTNEPVKVHQNINFKDYNPINHTRDYISTGVMQLGHAASVGFWPLLLAVFIFTDDTYAKIGGLVAISILISAFTAFMFGKYIDNRKGIYLLRYGALMYSIGQMLRATITNGSGALAVGIANEPSMLSVEMPLFKGQFDKADKDPKNRILYLMWIEITAALIKFVFCFGMFVTAFHFDPVSVLRASFVAVGLLTPLVLSQRFPALKKV